MCFLRPDRIATNSGCDSSRRGLTLFELLIVMMILAILVSLVIGLGRYADTIGKRHRAMADLGKWQEAVHRYHEFNNWGQFPALPQGQTDVSNLLNHAMCDANGTLTNRFCERLPAPTIHVLDPWNQPYQYVTPPITNPQSFDLYSLGPYTNITSDDIRFQP
jgi:prepilin-type N-terminal cleavage/methylation domain-containing protein